MEEYNADFEALEEIDKEAGQLFSPAGTRGTSAACWACMEVEMEKRLPPGKATVEYAVERQHYWTDVRLRARDRLRSGVAECAEARYGLILHEMTQNPADP